MGTHDVSYVWTAADVVIRAAASDPAKRKELAPCGGGFAQCLSGTDKKTGKQVHTCFVTPYGIRASLVEQRVEGTKGTIDLALASTGQPGLANRFGAALPWYPLPPTPTEAQRSSPPFAARGEWTKEFPCPPSVKDLGGLIAELSKLPNIFPASIYGDVKTAAQMLFDYWENSEWRYAVVSSGSFHWSTYRSSPEKIPIEASGKAGTKKISMVRMIRTVLKIALPPGLPPVTLLSKRTMDQMDAFIEELYASVRQVNGLIQLTEKSLQERMKPLMRLNALRQLAAATGGPTGAAISKKLDEILEPAHDGLVALPTRMNVTLDEYIDSFDKKRSLAMNAGDALAEEAVKLEKLLHEKNGANTKLCTEWGKGGLSEWTRTAASPLGIQRAATQFESLTDAMSHAVVALANARVVDDSDRMLEHLDSTAEDHATAEGKVEGDSPLKVVLSLAGKGASLATTVVGNNAGPPSLYIAVLQTYSTWKFAAVAKATTGQYTDDVVETFYELSKMMTDRLPKSSIEGVSLRATIRDAMEEAYYLNRSGTANGAELLAANQKVKELTKQMAEKNTGFAQTSVRWKGTITVLTAIATAAAIAELIEKVGDPEATLTIVDFGQAVGATASLGMTILGGVETYLTFRWMSPELIEQLGKYGNALGVVASVVTMCLEFAKFVKACEDGEVVDAIKSGAATVGSAGMALVAGAALAGVRVPIPHVQLVCLGLLVVSTTIDLVQSAWDPKSNAPNQVALSIVKGVKDDGSWRALVRSDSTFSEALKYIEEQLGSGKLPYLMTGPGREPGPFHDTLLKAGFSEETLGHITLERPNWEPDDAAD